MIPTTETDQNVITAIILFNAALSHHLLIAGQDSSLYATKHLLKARQLYELAHRTQDTDTNIMFEFAILNNVAMICREVGAETTANWCFAYMLSIWVLLLDRQDTSRLCQLRGFLYNIPSSITVSPAA